MPWSDILGAIVGIGLNLLMIYLVWKRGIRGMFDDIRQLIERIIEGPAPEPEPPKADLRKTAMMETEIYGEVVSESLKGMWKPTVIPPHECDFDVRTLGSFIASCTMCGKPEPQMKFNPLPDPVVPTRE